MVLVDTVHENQRIVIGNHAVRLRASATGRAIPPPRLEASLGKSHADTAEAANGPLDPPFDKLPLEDQNRCLWALAQPSWEPPRIASAIGPANI
jgi:hypothetical protein